MTAKFPPRSNPIGNCLAIFGRSDRGFNPYMSMNVFIDNHNDVYLDIYLYEVNNFNILIYLIL